MEKVKVILSGIELKYIDAYFKSIADQWNAYHYTGPNWTVEVIPQAPNEKGVIKLPRNKIYFSGESDVVDQVVSDYRRAFLSAGG